MRIRFIRSWQQYKPDQEFDFADGMANILIRRGIIVRVEIEKEKPSKVRRLIPPIATNA